MWSEDTTRNHEVPVRTMGPQTGISQHSVSLQYVTTCQNEDLTTPPPFRVGRKNQRSMKNIFTNVTVKKRTDYTSLHAKSGNSRCTLPGAYK